jgi:UDP:flavonoid glycosyltransferase YjiC (YdhE family)
MRILLATSSLASHHCAMVPFGWAALADGHEVRLATSPELTGAAARSGLPVVPVGPAIDFPALHKDLVRQVAEDGVRYDPKLLFCSVAEAMAGGLLELARSWRPDVVVWDPATLAAPLAAQAVGARSVRYLWGLDMIGRGTTLIERLPQRFRELYDRYGVELADDPDWWTFDPSPPSVWPVTTGARHPVRYIPFSPNGEPPGWLFGPGTRPRVCLTFGSGITVKEFVAGGGFGNSPIARAVIDLDVDVVLAVSPADRAALGTLPDPVRAVSDCPLSTLLPTCAAVVHHGGNGTLLTAALLGVPQVVLSYLPDLKFSAEAFAGSGAVAHLSSDQATYESVRELVSRALTDPSVREAAGAVRAEMLAQPLPGALLARFN